MSLHKLKFFLNLVIISKIIFPGTFGSRLTYLQNSDEKHVENVIKAVSHSIIPPLENCEIIILNDLKLKTKKHRFYFNLAQNLTCMSNPYNHIQMNRYIISLSQNQNRNATLTIAPGRFRYKCLIVLSLILEVKLSLSLFHSVAVGGYGGPTNQDTDYYVFITLSDAVNDILNSKISQRLKYKIVIPIYMNSKRNETIFGITKSPFCTFKQKGSCEMHYRVPLFHSMKVLQGGQWPSISEIFPDFTLNGQMYTLKVTSPVKYPFLVEIEKKNNGWICKRGIFKYILNSLILHFNFTFVISPSNNGDTGKQLPNGSWNGVIGDISSGRADIGVSTTYSPSRYKVVTFTRAFEYIWVTFMIGQPKKSYSWEAIMWPFQTTLWISILISLLAIILTFKVISRWEDLVMRKQIKFEFTVMQIVFTLLGKELPYPTSPSARIILSFWLLSALVINTLYVAKIVELLAFPVFQAQPKSFKELIDPSYHYKFGFDLSGGALYNHFESSSNPVLRKVFEDLSPPKEAVNCFTSALESNFACISWRGTADYIAYRNLSLVYGKSPLNAADDDKTLFVPQGLVLQRNSILKPNFNRYVEMLMDSGQAIKWTMDDLKELNKEKICWQKTMDNSNGESLLSNSEENNEKEKMLSLYNLLGVIYVYFIGNSAGVFAFVAEILRRKLFFIMYY